MKYGYIGDQVISLCLPLLISLRYLWYTDLDGVDALQEMVDILERNYTKVFLTGIVNESVQRTLEKHPFYQTKLMSGSVYTTYMDILNDSASLPNPEESIVIE
jgi:hypothetical protein